MSDAEGRADARVTYTVSSELVGMWPFRQRVWSALCNETGVTLYNMDAESFATFRRYFGDRITHDAGEIPASPSRAGLPK